MNEHHFKQRAKLAGFNTNQIDFMWECLAKIPHTHEIDEVEGLEEELEGLGVGEGEEDEEQDQGEES